MPAPERDPPPHDPVDAGESPRSATVLEVVSAVFGSFLGIRKGGAMRKDAVTIKPHQVILVGIALAALFVVSLLLLVRLILRSAGV